MLALSQQETADLIASSRTRNTTVDTLPTLERDTVWNIVNTRDEFLIGVAADGKRFVDGGIKSIWRWYNLAAGHFIEFVEILEENAGMTGIANVFKDTAAAMLAEGSSKEATREFLVGSKKNKGKTFDAVHVMKVKRLKSETKEVMKDISPVALEDQIRYAAVKSYSAVPDNMDLDSLKMARRNMLRLRGKLQ
ncbi:MAG: hypothetical protein DRP93_04295 [Candidatus Neomarinimicrobiota bacterium]|nr:MAG: hypothetical protein DRP93_04295 [Candidatus Neomarinimicrobiota bacterium]